MNKTITYLQYGGLVCAKDGRNFYIGQINHELHTKYAVAKTDKNPIIKGLHFDDSRWCQRTLREYPKKGNMYFDISFLPLAILNRADETFSVTSLNKKVVAWRLDSRGDMQILLKNGRIPRKDSIFQLDNQDYAALASGGYVDNRTLPKGWAFTNITNEGFMAGLSKDRCLMIAVAFCWLSQQRLPMVLNEKYLEIIGRTVVAQQTAARDCLGSVEKFWPKREHKYQHVVSAEYKGYLCCLAHEGVIGNTWNSRLFIGQGSLEKVAGRMRFSKNPEIPLTIKYGGGVPKECRSLYKNGNDTEYSGFQDWHTTKFGTTTDTNLIIRAAKAWLQKNNMVWFGPQPAGPEELEVIGRLILYYEDNESDQCASAHDHGPTIEPEYITEVEG